MVWETRRTLRLIALAAGAVVLPTRANACYYHWSHNLPEPVGIWPAYLARSSSPSQASLSVTASDAAGVAAADLIADDNSNDTYVTSWMINTTGKKGTSTDPTINSLVDTTPADVQTDAYTSSDIYIKASDVPSHTVGPFTGNPAYPADQNATWEIPRNPTVNTGTKTATANGAIAIAVNGVEIFNASDAMTYNNDGIWHQNANVFEASASIPDQAIPRRKWGVRPPTASSPEPTIITRIPSPC